MMRPSLLSPRTSLVFAAAIAPALVALSGEPAFANRRAAKPPEILENTMTGPPVLAVIAIKDQRVSVYDANGGVMRGRISSGRSGYETPVGVFSILQKNRDHVSNLYEDAKMPFMQRLTWSGVALHAGDLPGYPASHGCVRLPYGFAESIFDNTRIGMRVVLVRNNVAPVDISHPALPKPLAAGQAVVTKMAYEDGGDIRAHAFEPDLTNWPERQAAMAELRSVAAAKLVAANATAGPADAAQATLKTKAAVRAKAAKALRSAEIGKKSADDRVARAEKSLAGAKRPKDIERREQTKTKAIETAGAAEVKRAAALAALQSADSELAAATESAKKTSAAKDAAFAAAKDAERAMLPVSVFISRETQRVYVRQGHEPVFDAPVTIADVDEPIGTFVYTAFDYTTSGDDLKWTALSMTQRPPAEYARLSNKKSRNDVELELPLTDTAAASGALDRITLAPDVQTRIAAVAWPGSSLIISDEGPSKETGKGTDHIVVSSDDPQGALKIRPRQPPPLNYNRYYYDDGYGYGSYGTRFDRYGRPQRYYRPPPKPFFWW